MYSISGFQENYTQTIGHSSSFDWPTMRKEPISNVQWFVHKCMYQSNYSRHLRRLKSADTLAGCLFHKNRFFILLYVQIRYVLDKLFLGDILMGRLNFKNFWISASKWWFEAKNIIWNIGNPTRSMIFLIFSWYRQLSAGFRNYKNYIQAEFGENFFIAKSQDSALLWFSGIRD